MIAKFVFTELDTSGETEKFTDYFFFDTYGNVLDKNF